MPPIIPRIILKLRLRQRITLLAPPSLLAVRAHARPRLLPDIAVAWLREPSRAVAVAFVGERPAGSAGLRRFVVQVVQAVHAALVVLAAHVEVEAEGCEGGEA